jgi:hypothetical protein
VGWRRTTGLDQPDTDYSQIKQVIRECEVRYEELENKLQNEEDGQRKNKVIIFGL